MAHDTTLHIKVDSATNEQLSRLAAARGTSKGRLVRDAIAACYHVPIEELPVQQARAELAARSRLRVSGARGGGTSTCCRLYHSHRSNVDAGERTLRGSPSHPRSR
jgi:predicted transcriptional regulator